MLFKKKKEKENVEERENIRRRKFTGNMKKLITIICIAMSSYHLYAAVVIGINPLQQRAFHLAFVLTLVFLLYPATRKSPKDKPSFVDLICVVLSLIAVTNIIIRFPSLARSGGAYIPSDIYFGLLTIILVIEATRRVLGWALPIMALILLAYGLFGQYVPGPLMHGGFSITRIIRHLTLTTEGIYGQILGVSSTYIYLFILFGAFLGVTGMSGLFNDIALALAGGSRGGPAKVSILSSGLMGTVSGSTSANVVTTGTFTIPLMMRTGFKDYFASAVEAASSAGGQIMPPIMGSAAFIISDTLGIPFVQVLKAAILPAVLYYFSLWVMVDLRARKNGFVGLSKSELPDLKKAIKERGHLLIPLIGIVYMLIAGYNAITAAVTGIVLSIISSFLKKDTRIKPKELISALEKGALNAIGVAIACAIIGIVVGVTTLSGAILTLGNAVLSLSGGLLMPTLILTMIVCVIMGMGLPTTACYVLTSAVAAPILTGLGVLPIQAHLFVFYYGILSTITPPVATGAYAAAGLSGANPGKTGWAGIKIAIAGFIIPYMFVYSPELLLPAGMSIVVLVRVICTSLIGIVALGCSVEGFIKRKLSLVERALFAVSAVLLINSGAITDIVGIGIFAVLIFIQIVGVKKDEVIANNNI